MPTMNAQGDDPITGAAAVTPSDTVDLARSTRAIVLGAVGTLKVDFVDGSTVTFASGALAAGVVHWLAIRRVYSTGTSATGLVVLF